MPAQSGGLPREANHDPVTTMSYHRKRGSRGLGDVAQTITTSVAVVQDPYFPEAICRIDQLRSIENGLHVLPCTNTPPNKAGGVGLRKVMPLMRAYVTAEQHRPWSYVGLAAAVIGLPMLVGYAIGKKG